MDWLEQNFPSPDLKFLDLSTRDNIKKTFLVLYSVYLISILYLYLILYQKCFPEFTIFIKNRINSFVCNFFFFCPLKKNIFSIKENY